MALLYLFRRSTLFNGMIKRYPMKKSACPIAVIVAVVQVNFVFILLQPQLYS